MSFQPFTLVVEGNETFLINVSKLLPSRRVLKTLRESLKRTISASGGLEPLQMVLELDTVRCVSDDAGLQGR